MDATTIGVDLAKRVFEVAVANTQGRSWNGIGSRGRNSNVSSASTRRRTSSWKRVRRCIFWARTLQAHGHRVSLLPAQYVRPYVRRNKTDRTDAEALLEAGRSGRITPVTVKTVVQQELLALHRVRDQWMATRTARINALRGFLQELAKEDVGRHGLPFGRACVRCGIRGLTPLFRSGGSCRLERRVRRRA
jgi:transposase